MEEFESTINKNSEKIIEFLNSNSELTSWDIKLKLKLSSSMLYICLGYLLQTKKIKIYPDQLNYKIKLEK